MRVEPDHLPKAPPPNPILSGIRFQQPNVVEMQTFILQHPYSWNILPRIASSGGTFLSLCSFIVIFPSPAVIPISSYWFVTFLSPVRSEPCCLRVSCASTVPAIMLRESLTSVPAVNSDKNAAGRNPQPPIHRRQEWRGAGH